MAFDQASAIVSSAARTACSSSSPSIVRHGDQRVSVLARSSLKRLLVGHIVGADELVLLGPRSPRVLPRSRQTPLLHVGAHVEVELDQQCPVIALLGLELIDLVEHASDQFFGGPAKHPVIESAAVPAVEEDRRSPGVGS